MNEAFRPTHLSWEVSLPVQSHPDKLLQLTRVELFSIAQKTTLRCIDTIASTFSLPGDTVNSIWDRANQLDVELVDGKDYGEFSQNNPERLFVGPATLAIAETVDLQLAGQQRTTVYFALSSISDEIANIGCANNGLRSIVADNPSLVKDESIVRLDELSQPAKILETALALAFARRLLKYGLLPDDALTPTMSRAYGFDDWLEHCMTMANREEEFTKKDRQLLIKAYEAGGQAAKNLRHTVWTELFYDLVGIDPQIDPSFYLLYYSPAMGKKNDHTISFNDPRTCNVNTNETTEYLNYIFNPAGHKLKSV